MTSSEQHGTNLVLASRIMCLNCLYLLWYRIVPNIIFFYIGEVSTDNLV
jgi:ABC-type antimicrobial peptide transport system permease subunit